MKVPQLRFTYNYILPFFSGSISSILVFLVWQAINSSSVEGTVFMICASASAIILIFGLVHYQAMLCKVLSIETVKMKNKKLLSNLKKQPARLSRKEVNRTTNPDNDQNYISMNLQPTAELEKCKGHGVPLFVAHVDEG